ncbi:hypothetical protein EGW08_019824, partial [Elysia chlorotica]
TQSSETLRPGKDSSKVDGPGTSNNSVATPSKRTEADAQPKSQADLALKQLLKIGVAQSGGSPVQDASLSPQPQPQPHVTTSSATPSAPAGQASPRSGGTTAELGTPTAYGRQVSLQELFEEANKQQQQQNQQQQQQQQPPQLNQPPPSLGGSHPVENRNPIAEVEAFCQAAFNNGEVHFDFKSQPKQNGFVATVSLPNGHKYDGSVCKTKQDASYSAASMALLCLKTSQGQATHPVITGSMPGAMPQRGPPMNRFFSPNSAFTAIGLQGR